MTREELLAQINRDPYNEVSAHLMPSGELCISLSHRITSDEAVIVRIREDDDIISWHDNKRFEPVNKGGDWPS